MNGNYAVHHVYFLENGSISMTRILNAQKGIPQTANGKRQTSNCGLQSVGNLDLKVSNG